MITFSANIRKATANSNDAITTSSVGIPVALRLASEFNGLAKTVIFKAGAVAVDVVLTGDQTETVVPPDVLAVAGEWLRIGIYAADNDGNVVIPTVWASPGVISPGATPSGVDPSAPTPSWVAQVQSIASQASEDASDALAIAQGVKAQADAGDFDGAPGQDGTDGTDGYSPTVSVEEIPGGHEVIITDINGEHSFDVMDGQDGAPGQNGAPGADGAPGAPGADGADGVSPEVTIASITGGHSVTITDADHPSGQTFNVMDGTNGTNGQDGAPGAGVASGGTTGQYLKKKSGTDYDTEWGTLPSIPSSASDVGAVAVAQGVGHSGEFLVVGSDGNVTTVTLATWQGGSY